MLEDLGNVKRLEEIWPDLPTNAWKESCRTVHLWTQIVGKIELELNPISRKWWESSFIVTPLGISTHPIYFKNRSFTLAFNFYEHLLHLTTSEGIRKSLSLESLSVSEFYYEVFKILSEVGISVKINPLPVETEKPTRFPEDKSHHTYQRVHVKNFHKILLQTDRIMKMFGGNYSGKMSPPEFLWGSFELVSSRFSGKESKIMGATGPYMKETFTQEVITFGFTPLMSTQLGPVFYIQASPSPIGFNSSDEILPKKAFFNEAKKSWVLKYSDVRKSDNPDQMILDFFDSCYEVAATLSGWDRKRLEKNFH